MSSVVSYLLGLATLPVIAGLVWFHSFLRDCAEARRYQRAWDKFAAEWDNASEYDRNICRKIWADQWYRYGHICDDRSRYFTMKWQGGNTKEV